MPKAALEYLDSTRRDLRVSRRLVARVSGRRLSLIARSKRYYVPDVLLDSRQKRRQLGLTALDTLQVRFPLPGHRRTLPLGMDDLDETNAFVRRFQTLAFAHDETTL